MKTSKFFFLLIGLFFFNSCSDVIQKTVTYKVNEPVFMDADEFRSLVHVSHEPHSIINEHGKIAFYKGYMYVSEPEKGIHIIDNRTPESPEIIGFIELLGNVDMAIKDDILYADSYIDMVWFEINEDPASPVLKGRIEDVFPQALPQPDNTYWCDYDPSEDKSKGIVVGWKEETRTETYMLQRNWPWGTKEDYDNGLVLNNSGNVGQTGSMSRFAIYKNYLYTVQNNRLGIFNIETGTPSKSGKNINVGWEVETLFGNKDNLFLGTPTGMLIYSVTNPVKPEYISSLQHVYGCDPVVVYNDIAYVTVHSGNSCGQNNNILMVIDVKDVKNPKAIVTYQMNKPKGLAIDNNILFVCDEGLKVYDATNPEEIKANILEHFNNIDGYDVIAFDKILIMIAADGIYQYDYSDLKNIKPISRIPINRVSISN